MKLYQQYLQEGLFGPSIDKESIKKDAIVCITKMSMRRRAMEDKLIRKYAGSMAAEQMFGGSSLNIPQHQNDLFRLYSGAFQDYGESKCLLQSAIKISRSATDPKLKEKYNKYIQSKRNTLEYYQNHIVKRLTELGESIKNRKTSAAQKMYKDVVADWNIFKRL